MQANSAPAVALAFIGDQRLLCDGLAALMQDQHGYRVLPLSRDVDAALALIREARPGVVLLDFGLRSHDSLSLTTRLRAEAPETKVIVMGVPPRRKDVASYVHAGTSGFIMKDASFEDFVGTVRAVVDGAEVLPPALTDTLFSQVAHPEGGSGRSAGSVRLTRREREVIALLAGGLSNKEIALRLNIAVHTVKSHVHNLLEKLALTTRLEVAAFAHSTGLSRPTEP
jgi:DNA-binding NarL/FixJ family response regulator